MKIFRLIGIMTLLVFSFYLTDFVTELAINTNPIMQSIKINSNNYFVESVNATIDKNTIIPGIKGKKINEMESFLNMKDFGAFNSNYIIYDDIKPEISIESNKDKIIISGNKNIRQVSLLLFNNDNLIEYLKSNKIKYSKLINSNDILDVNENINIENDKKLFDNIDTLLKKKDLNKKICILNYSNIESCKEKEYYLVKPTYIVKNNNIINIINNIESGNILLIENNLSIENLKLLISRINNKDIEINYLSDLIKE
ncbi:MAG: hypothetical protein IJD92_03885 [Bacilli bacterium]|nr:hypothetical protein [Bacilli bacterium]